MIVQLLTVQVEVVMLLHTAILDCVIDLSLFHNCECKISYTVLKTEGNLICFLGTEMCHRFPQGEQSMISFHQRWKGISHVTTTSHGLYNNPIINLQSGHYVWRFSLEQLFVIALTFGRGEQSCNNRKQHFLSLKINVTLQSLFHLQICRRLFICVNRP